MSWNNGATYQSHNKLIEIEGHSSDINPGTTTTISEMRSEIRNSTLHSVRSASGWIDNARILSQSELIKMLKP